MLEVQTTSAENTKQLGSFLSTFLQAGDVIRLDGELGAGKTTFAQGLCRGLGVKGQVTSPTFTILHIYDGILPVYHVDAYRITSEEQLVDLGLEEYFEGQGVSIIEWAENIIPILPQSYLLVELCKTGEENTRIIRFTSPGQGRYAELVKEMAVKCGY